MGKKRKLKISVFIDQFFKKMGKCFFFAEKIEFLKFKKLQKNMKIIKNRKNFFEN